MLQVEASPVQAVPSGAVMALVVLAYFVAQHGDGPIPPVGGEGGVPEGDSLLREVFFAGAAVEKRGGAA